MLPTRKIGKLLRGKATPFQLIAASVLGTCLGFAPSPLQAPALMALLVAALLAVNANLGLALLCAGLGGLLSLVVAPVSFRIGEFLLDGPFAGLAEAVVNAPVLAWCGLSYYAVAGGQLLALLIGTGIGLLVTRAVNGFRRRMVAARDKPSKARELAAKPWGRALTWIFFGGTGKGSWEDKLEKRVGNPIRIWGAALIVIVVVGAAVAHRQLAEPLARGVLQDKLASANGATVDVGPLALDLGEGRVAISQLALADPKDLARDLFRAGHLEADVDQADFLRRRFHVAKLVVSEAQSGVPRETPGEVVGPEPDEEEEPADDEGPIDLENISLEQVLGEYEVWKGRLSQARKWLDRLSGGLGSEKGDESLTERLAREVSERGWFSVEADHLMNEAPTFRLSELLVEGFQASYLPGRTLDLQARELSTQPGLVDAPPTLEITSRDGALGLLVDLAPASRLGGDGALRFHLKSLDVDAVMSKLSLPGGQVPFRGGTLDLVIDGAWDGGRIGFVDLPLRVVFHGTTLTLGDLKPQALDELELEIGIRGPLDSPRLDFDADALTDALVDAGKQELANQLEKELDGEVKEKLDELKEKTGIELPGGEGLLEGLLGGKKKKPSDGP